MKMTKKSMAVHVEQAFYAHARNVQIPIMKLPAIHKAGMDAMERGVSLIELSEVMKNAIAAAVQS